MTEEKPALNLAIRKLRKEYLGCSQSRLAEELDVSTDTISRWERGKTEPSKLQRRFLMGLAARSEAPEELIKALSTGDEEIERYFTSIATGLAAGVGAAAGGIFGPLGAVGGAIPGALMGATTAGKLLGKRKSEGKGPPQGQTVRREVRKLPPQIRRMRNQVRRSADYLGVEEERFREEILSILETAAGAEWELKTLIRGLYALSDLSEDSFGDAE